MLADHPTTSALVTFPVGATLLIVAALAFLFIIVWRIRR